MATKILTIYYKEDHRFRVLNFFSDRTRITNDWDNGDSANIAEWSRDHRVYRIVHYPLDEALRDPLLVVDVVGATITFDASDSLELNAFIYSPLAENIANDRTSHCAPWQIKLRAHGGVEYSSIKIWSGGDELAPRPPAGQYDRLALMLADREKRQLPSVSKSNADVNFEDLNRAMGLKLTGNCSGWEIQAIFVHASTLFGDAARKYYVIEFRAGTKQDCGPAEFDAFGDGQKLRFTPGQWSLLHRPASTISENAAPAEDRTTQVSMLHVFRVLGEDVAGLWNRWADEYHRSLLTVSGAQPASFVPTFSFPKQEASEWVMSYRLTTYFDDFKLNDLESAVPNSGQVSFYHGTDRFADPEFVVNRDAQNVCRVQTSVEPLVGTRQFGPFTSSADATAEMCADLDASRSNPLRCWAVPQPNVCKPPSVTAGVVFAPLSLVLGKPENQAAQVGVLRMPGVIDVYGYAVENLDLGPLVAFTPAASAAGFSAVDEVDQAEGIVIQFKEVAAVTGAAPLVRMGSLDLAFGGPRVNGSDQNDKNWLILRRDAGLPSAFVDVFFTIADLAPGGQDDPPNDPYVAPDSDGSGLNPCFIEKYVKDQDPTAKSERLIAQGFRRERPLVIHIDQDQSSQIQYTLRVNESTPPRGTRSLSLNVYSQTLQAGQASNDDMCFRKDLRRAFVLDRSPFLVAEVLYPPFEAVAGDESSAIATWNSGGAAASTWMLQFRKDPFCLVLPPQGIGEEMVKSQMPDRPDPPNQALPFRFSGNTRITANPRQQNTSFSEPPWNLRRILGTPQDPLPGPMVTRIQYEMLYGMSCSDQTLEPSAFRLAELMARIGQIPPARPQTVWTTTKQQTDEYNKARLDWSALYQRYLSRIAVLEPWSGPIASTTSQVSLTEVKCTLRTGVLGNPITPGPGDFRGGATWGFESYNVFRSLAPNSTTATLDNFSLSSLGGWGQQRAQFGPLTTFYADVNMGRTSTYKLEQIGRIAVWWVAAKHVIVYKRTVAPSRQFFTRQPQYDGWPVARKVEEYVEILEDARAYPDNVTDPGASAAARQACGPIQSILLKKGTRFNVDSTWGSDVNQSSLTGWKVPLWNPGAWPPDVYPKPAVGIGAQVADGTSGVKQPPVCDNPENLFFFTLTSLIVNGQAAAIDADPHKWDPVPDIDYVNVPPPQPPADFAMGDLRQTVPTPSLVPPALGPCTFRLRPGASATNLVANRAGKQMAVVLESITVSRAKSTFAPLSGAATVVQKVQTEVQAQYASILRALPADPSLALSANIWSDVGQKATAAVAPLKQRITDAATQIDGVIRKIEQDAQNFEAGLRDRFGAALDKAVSDLTADCDRFVQDQSTFDADLAKAFLATMERQFEQALLFPQSAPGSLAAMVSAYVDAASSIRQTVANAVQTFNTDLQNWQNATDADVQELQRNKTVQDLNSAFTQAIATANALKTLRRPLDSLPDLYAWASAQLGPILTNIEDDCSKFIAGLTDVNAAAQALATFKASAFYQAAGIDLDANTLADNVKALINQALPAGETVADVAGAYQKLHQLDVWVHGFPKDAPTGNTGQLAAWASACKILGDNLKTAQDLANSITLIKTYLTSVNPPPNPPQGWPKISFAQARATFIADIQKHADAVTTLFAQEMSQMKTRLENAVDSLSSMLQKQAQTTVDQLSKAIGSIRDDLSQQAEKYLDKTFHQLTDSTVYQTADGAFRLIRAFGAPPQVPNLGFDRDKVAYFFQEVDPQVNLTPVLARVAQAGAILDALKTLGVSLPTLGALDQLVPASLKGFNLSDIFGNFAGLDLTHLFPGLKLPDLDNKAVQITHDFDPQTLRATVGANVNFTLTDSSDLFSIGPLTVSVLGATFNAKSTLTVDKTGARKTASGTISGNWQLSLGGNPIVLLHKTELTFDDSGHISFSVKPQNVEIPGALKVVTDLLNKFVSADSGLTFGMLPRGFQAVLNLPVPDMQAVTSGFSNLKLGALFTIEFANSFSLGAGFSLASKQAPFSLTMFILGGGGYVSARANYAPASRQISCIVDMAVTASASLAISLDVISGGVYVYFGATASYNTQGQGLSFGVMILIRGECSVLGIVSAAISLLLQAVYSSGQVTGIGQLSIKITICWCFTLEVNDRVSYSLGHGQGVAAVRPRRGPMLAETAGGPFAQASDAGPSLGAVPADIFEQCARTYVQMLV